jgi:hypothetical protein
MARMAAPWQRALEIVVTKDRLAAALDDLDKYLAEGILDAHLGVHTA